MPLRDSEKEPASDEAGSDVGGSGDGAGRVRGRSEGGRGEGNVGGGKWCGVRGTSRREGGVAWGLNAKESVEPR